MALFTDGAISTIQDLVGYESGLLETARIEGIDLTAKLELAERELEIEIRALLAREDLTMTIDQVVVTMALETWHRFKTLALAYRDAYNLQLNDRYQGKWKEYERLGLWAQHALWETGLGMVVNPIPRAATPTIASTSVTGVAGAAYYISVSWASGLEEGAPSLPVVFVAADGTVPVVQAVAAPASATGWNVYVGTEQGVQTLQNDAPLPVDAEWTMPETGLIAGREMGSGQAAQVYQQPRRTFLRG